MTLRQIENARAHPKGCINDWFPALAFAAFSVEAYANYALSKINPNASKREVRKQNSKSLQDKLTIIFTELNQPAPDLEADPFRSVIELKKLRDALAHGQPILEDVSQIWDDEDGSDPPEILTDLYYQIPLYSRMLKADWLGVENFIHQVVTLADTIESMLIKRLLLPSGNHGEALTGVLSDSSSGHSLTKRVVPREAGV